MECESPASPDRSAPIFEKRAVVYPRIERAGVQQAARTASGQRLNDFNTKYFEIPGCATNSAGDGARAKLHRKRGDGIYDLLLDLARVSRRPRGKDTEIPGGRLLPRKCFARRGRGGGWLSQKEKSGRKRTQFHRSIGIKRVQAPVKQTLSFPKSFRGDCGLVNYKLTYDCTSVDNQSLSSRIQMLR